MVHKVRFCGQLSSLSHCHCQIVIAVANATIISVSAAPAQGSLRAELEDLIVR